METNWNIDPKHSEYGLLWSAVTEAGKIVVSDDIQLNCEMQFVKEAETKVK